MKTFHLLLSIIGILHVQTISGRSIFRCKDTIEFYRVITEILDSPHFNVGCHYVWDRNTGVASISCDTIKPARLICVLGNKRVFWHEDPLDSSFRSGPASENDHSVYVHTQPFPLFGVRFKKKRVYYFCENWKLPDRLQFLLKKDTCFTDQISIKYWNSMDAYYSIYLKDTIIYINNKSVKCSLFYGRSYVPDTDGIRTYGEISEYLICVEKKHHLPILTFESLSKILYDPREEKVSYKECRKSVLFPHLKK